MNDAVRRFRNRFEGCDSSLVFAVCSPLRADRPLRPKMLLRLSLDIPRVGVGDGPPSPSSAAQRGHARLLRLRRPELVWCCRENLRKCTLYVRSRSRFDVLGLHRIGGQPAVVVACVGDIRATCRYHKFPARGRRVKRNGEYCVCSDRQRVHVMLCTAIAYAGWYEQRYNCLRSSGLKLPKAWHWTSSNNIHARKHRPNQEAGKNLHNQPTSNKHQPQGSRANPDQFHASLKMAVASCLAGDVGQPSTNRTVAASPLGRQTCMPNSVCNAARTPKIEPHLSTMCN